MSKNNESIFKSNYLSTLKNIKADTANWNVEQSNISDKKYDNHNDLGAVSTKKLNNYALQQILKQHIQPHTVNRGKLESHSQSCPPVENHFMNNLF